MINAQQGVRRMPGHAHTHAHASNLEDYHTALRCAVWREECIFGNQKSRVSSLDLMPAKGFQFDLMMPGQIQRVSAAQSKQEATRHDRRH